MCALMFCAHIIVLSTRAEASCESDPEMAPSTACYFDNAFKGMTTMGPFYLFAYLAPVGLAVAEGRKHKRVVVGTTMGIVLGASRLIRILLFDEFIQPLEN